jgi:site-specific recombinase XerD
MQKYSFRFILREDKKNSDGRCPIYLRITVDRKTSYSSTGHFIMPKLWDKKAEQVRPEHALASEINTDLLQRKQEVFNRKIKAGDTKVTARDLKELAAVKSNLFAFADRYREEMRSKREPATLENWRKHMAKLELYHGSGELNFEEVTPEYLIRFEKWLMGEGVNRRTDTGNYAHAVIKSIRKMFTAAAAKGLTTAYPFRQYEMPRATPADKDHLTLAELDTWTKYYKNTTNPLHREAALYFLFGCYSGLRVSDWYLFDIKKRVQGDHIALRAKKNGGWVTVPLTKRLKYVIGEMKKVPLVSDQQKINDRFNDIAAACKINKHLSTHCGRKTFAVTMCLERGISSETAATLMGITLNIFSKSYAKVTPQKIRQETSVGWKGL